MITVPIADALQRGRTAGQNQYGLALTRMNAAAATAQNEQLLAGLEQIQQAQEVQAKDLQVALGALSDALTIQAEATRGLEAMQKSESDETQKILAAAATAQQRFTEGVQKTIRALEARVQLLEGQIRGFFGQSETSAGGFVRTGRRADKGVGQVPMGMPHATGDIVLSANGARPGWLPCDGSERKRESYAELAYVLGDYFGSPSTRAWFKVPSQAQIINLLTGAVTTNRWRFWIRT